MEFIDVIIPAIGGIACFLLPVKETGNPEQDEKNRGRMKLCGVSLIVVAFVYGLIKLSQQGA